MKLKKLDTEFGSPICIINTPEKSYVLTSRIYLVDYNLYPETSQLLLSGSLSRIKAEENEYGLLIHYPSGDVDIPNGKIKDMSPSYFQRLSSIRKIKNKLKK